MQVEKTTNFVRIRLRNPSEFKKGTFRQTDVGRDVRLHKIDYTGRIAGKLKSNDKWATQSYLVARYHPTGKARTKNEVTRDVKKLVGKANQELARKRGGGWYGQSERHSQAIKRGKRRRR